ncbi:hypothetical protein NPIL_286721, partial [Nephila pilipes]
MRGVLFLGLIACWTVVCNCEDGWTDSGALASTTDLDEYLLDLLKADSFFLSDETCDCGKKGKCTLDEEGQKKCTCDPGYSESGDGEKKTCEAMTCECGDKGKCTRDEKGQKKCTCDPGYSESGDGEEKTCK